MSRLPGCCSHRWTATSGTLPPSIRHVATPWLQGSGRWFGGDLTLAPLPGLVAAIGSAIESFVDEVIVTPLVICASLAMSNPGYARALAVTSTWAWPAPPAEFHTRVFPWRTMHAPIVGPYPFGHHNVLARRGMYLSIVGREKFRREAQAVYEAALPNAEARLLTWVWPRWILLDDTARGQGRCVWLEAGLTKSRLPTLIVWGREDDVFDAATFSERFKRMLPHADDPHTVTGRHFPQEDSSPEIASLIAIFLDRLGRQESV